MDSSITDELTLVGSLTACSNSDTQEEAESAVCTSLAEVKTAAAGVKSLEAARDEIEDGVQCE